MADTSTRGPDSLQLYRAAWLHSIQLEQQLPAFQVGWCYRPKMGQTKKEPGVARVPLPTSVPAAPGHLVSLKPSYLMSNSMVERPKSYKPPISIFGIQSC